MLVACRFGTRVVPEGWDGSVAELSGAPLSNYLPCNAWNSTVRRPPLHLTSLPATRLHTLKTAAKCRGILRYRVWRRRRRHVSSSSAGSHEPVAQYLLGAVTRASTFRQAGGRRRKRLPNGAASARIGQNLSPR